MTTDKDIQWQVRHIHTSLISITLTTVWWRELEITKKKTNYRNSERKEQELKFEHPLDNFTNWDTVMYCLLKLTIISQSLQSGYMIPFCSPINTIILRDYDIITSTVYKLYTTATMAIPGNRDLIIVLHTLVTMVTICINEFTFHSSTRLKTMRERPFPIIAAFCF